MWPLHAVVLRAGPFIAEHPQLQDAGWFPHRNRPLSPNWSSLSTLSILCPECPGICCRMTLPLNIFTSLSSGVIRRTIDAPYSRWKEVLALHFFAFWSTTTAPFPTSFVILYPQNPFPVATNCRDCLSRLLLPAVVNSLHRCMHTEMEKLWIWPLTPLSMLDPPTGKMNDSYNSFTIFCLIYLFHKIVKSLNTAAERKAGVNRPHRSMSYCLDVHNICISCLEKSIRLCWILWPHISTVMTCSWPCLLLFFSLFLPSVYFTTSFSFPFSHQSHQAPFWNQLLLVFL